MIYSGVLATLPTSTKQNMFEPPVVLIWKLAPKTIWRRGEWMWESSEVGRGEEIFGSS